MTTNSDEPVDQGVSIFGVSFGMARSEVKALLVEPMSDDGGAGGEGLRRMNKKLSIRAIALALLLLAALAGCGGTSEQGAPAATLSQTPTQTPASAAPIPPEAPVSPEESTTESEAIHVSTAGGLLEAIAPGAVIELAPGTYNLTEYLREASDHISDYAVRSFTDGWQAEIDSVEGLTLRGAEGGKIEVVTEPRYSDVLHFNDCTDITIENITFGHTIEQGNCQGAVLAFDDCRDIHLDGLDLYGCGTYGVAADNTSGLALKNCIIRDCSYGIIDLSSCGDAVLDGCTFRDNGGFDMLSLNNAAALFRGCTFAGNSGDSFLPSYNYPKSECSVRFENCSFGQWESLRLKEEMKDFGSDVTATEDCSWSDATAPFDSSESQENASEWAALDTTRLKVASFDAKVLSADEYYILYEIVNKTSGEVSFETSDDVRFLTFEENGRGCFWTDNEKGRPFRYEMDSAYSCAISFDDGGKASFGLYVDQGGALPTISEENHIWLALYLNDETLWFY